MSRLSTRAALGALAVGLLAVTVPVSGATAQLVPGNTYPAAILPVDVIPESKDIDYPGTLKVHVDATDTLRRAFKVRQTIPVATSGDTVLFLPEWLPGKHGPRGTVNRVAELVFSVDGKTVPWVRDPVHTHGFHIEVPKGAKTIEARFTALTALERGQGRVKFTPNMLSLQFEDVALYPAGYYTRRIPIQASVTYPTGWKAASALRPASTKGDTVTYQTVNYETLQDSPILAGRYYRQDKLSDDVFLNSFAEEADQLKANNKVVERMSAMVDQADKLFGARHFDHYDFLNSVSDKLGGIGLEHHRSTEISSEEDFFTAKEWPAQEHQVFPHELVHSWDGKYRRGNDLYTPDFHTPMRDSYLWVYEGQTQFWGWVLDARSGLSDKQGALDYLALTADRYASRIGRNWRPLVDTTNDPIITMRQPQPWTDLLRNEDYYSEGLLIWLEADAIIRKGTNNARGMDDFAKAFFGMRDGDWGVLPYDRSEIITKLNALYPYDWATFLKTRVDDVAPKAPLGGITLSGYELRYLDTPNAYMAKALKGAKSFGYSLGASIDKEGAVKSVNWEGVAYKAGLMNGDSIIAVGEEAFTQDALEAAILAAAKSRKPIPLTVKRDERVWTLALPYYDGMRYPHLVKTGTGEGPLDLLLKPR